MKIRLTLDHPYPTNRRIPELQELGFRFQKEFNSESEGMKTCWTAVNRPTVDFCELEEVMELSRDFNLKVQIDGRPKTPTLRLLNRK